MTRVLLSIGVYVSLALPCFANNCYFIPGDAFFYFEVDQAEWEDLESGKLSIMDYDRPEGMPFFLCGYVGYEKLDIGNLPDEYRAQLIKAVGMMKEKFPTKVIEIDHGEPNLFGAPSGIEEKEINKIRIFVHNNSFDFSKSRIALKYNESWPEFPVKLGHTKKHFRYDFFVPSAKGIAESWKMGADVNPLAVTFPDSDRGYVTIPMKIDPTKIKFLICPPTSLTSLCFPPRDIDFECFVVSQDGIVSLSNDKTRRSVWIQTK